MAFLSILFYFQDAERVMDRFRYAEGCGVLVEQRSVSLPDILSHLLLQKPIIILTNARLLQCRLCAFSSTRHSLRKACFGSCGAPYQGHFVVLRGFDDRNQLMYYSNPSVREEVCCCTYDEMEEARLAYGTDEDIIFVDSVVKTAAPTTT